MFTKWFFSVISILNVQKSGIMCLMWSQKTFFLEICLNEAIKALVFSFVCFVWVGIEEGDSFSKYFTSFKKRKEANLSNFTAIQL